MSDINLDSTGDIELIEGSMSLNSTNFAIAQHLRSRLRTFYGEWFLDISKGVPYFEQILIKNPNPVSVDSILKKEILETDGVLELREFDLDLNPTTRELTLTFEARTITGSVEFSEVIP